ncbi:methyltransferase domain-containing protein [candidate division KSB1 bacterium]|nr:methyltransferase domain-containing protein [candidate division KSB1 bacterium]
MNDRESLKKFYEQVGEKYPEEEQVYSTLRGMLRRRFVVSKLSGFSGSLLDIGCNRGMYLRIYTGGPRFGIDLSSSVLKKAGGNNGIHYAVADAEFLTCFRPASFDNVLCSEVLEHCLNPQAVFDGIARVLNPNGSALLTTPNYGRKRPHWIGLGILENYAVETDCAKGYYHTAYHPSELAEMAHRAGLTVVQIGTLEKEIKYATKIPVVLLLTGRMVNRIFRSKRFQKWNERVFEKLSILLYRICYITGLDKYLSNLVPNGVRSYIVMQKTTENPE